MIHWRLLSMDIFYTDWDIIVQRSLEQETTMTSIWQAMNCAFQTIDKFRFLLFFFFKKGWIILINNIIVQYYYAIWFNEEVCFFMYCISYGLWYWRTVRTKLWRLTSANNLSLKMYITTQMKLINVLSHVGKTFIRNIQKV